VCRALFLIWSLADGERGRWALHGSLFFFFSSRRRHTRCLSDWSSDVCSSDLSSPVLVPKGANFAFADEKLEALGPVEKLLLRMRSEERRVGKECRSRGAVDQLKKKIESLGYDQSCNGASASRCVYSEYVERWR